MTTPHSRAAAQPSSDRLKVRRVQAGEQLHVKILSDVEKRVMGLLYHWEKARKGHSVPCPTTCPPTFHRCGPHWHGYLAVEIWCETAGPWWPWVLEVTEHLEQDMRGKVKRGQTWLIQRVLNDKGKYAEVAGVLTEECPPHAVPMAFDMRPVLWSIYHRCDIELWCANPLPDRVYVRGSDAPPPAAIQPEESEQTMSAEDLAERRKKLRDRGFVKAMNKVHERNGG